MAPIITLDDLAPWVGKAAGELDGDTLAQVVIEQASNLVVLHGRGTVDWFIEGATVPQVAKDIAVQAARRVYTNPRAVEMRTAGPISERMAADLVTGMALTPGEINTLSLARTGGGGGLWIQPMETGRTESTDRPTWGLNMQLGPDGLITGSKIQPWRYYGEEG